MWDDDDDDLDLSNIDFLNDAVSSNKGLESALPTESNRTSKTSILPETNKKMKLTNNEDNFVNSFQAIQSHKTVLHSRSALKVCEENLCANEKLNSCDEIPKQPAKFSFINANCINKGTPSTSTVLPKAFVGHRGKVPSFLCSKDDSELDLDLSQWEAAITNVGTSVKRKTSLPPKPSLSKNLTNPEDNVNIPSNSIIPVKLDRTACCEKPGQYNMDKNNSAQCSALEPMPVTPPDEEFSSVLNKCYAASIGLPRKGTPLLGSVVTNSLERTPPSYCTLKTPTTHESNSKRSSAPFASDAFSRHSNQTSSTFSTPVGLKTPRLSLGGSRRRKFPGPAGLLPQLSTDDPVKLTELSGVEKSPSVSINNVAQLSNADIPSSQNSDDDFVRKAWVTMEVELQLSQENQSNFLTKYSIAWLIKKASAKQLPCGKMPFLAVIVKSLTVKGVDACAVFRDKSGEILGTIHRQLLEECSNILQVGSVLVLKQIGIFSPSNRRHYLNVTKQNVLYIYNAEENGKVACNKLFDGYWCEVAKEVEDFSTACRPLDVNCTVVTMSRTLQPQCNYNLTVPEVQKTFASFGRTCVNPSPRTAQLITNKSCAGSSSTKSLPQLHAHLTPQQNQSINMGSSKTDQTVEIVSRSQSSCASTRQNFTFRPSGSLQNRSQKTDAWKISQVNNMLINNVSTSKEAISWQEDDFDKLLEDISEEELLRGSGCAKIPVLLLASPTSDYLVKVHCDPTVVC